MSAAQKKNQDNFKKAIAYRKKTGCTLKEAFAHIKGFDGVTKKGNKTTVHYSKSVAPKKAAKKVAPKKKVASKKVTHKQGKLFGVNNSKNIIGTELKKILNNIDTINTHIADLELKLKNSGTSIKDKKFYRQYITELKQHKTQLKKLL